VERLSGGPTLLLRRKKLRCTRKSCAAQEVAQKKAAQGRKLRRKKLHSAGSCAEKCCAAQEVAQKKDSPCCKSAAWLADCDDGRLDCLAFHGAQEHLVGGNVVHCNMQGNTKLICVRVFLAVLLIGSLQANKKQMHTSVVAKEDSVQLLIQFLHLCNCLGDGANNQEGTFHGALQH